MTSYDSQHTARRAYIVSKKTQKAIDKREAAKAPKAEPKPAKKKTEDE